MTMQESVATCLKKYADFNGRATRSEYWWFILASMLVGIILGFINPLLSSILSYILILPTWAVASRRLHDINKSGWWQLTPMIPVTCMVILILLKNELWKPVLIVMLICIFVLILWLVEISHKGANKYGEDPLRDLED